MILINARPALKVIAYKSCGEFFYETEFGIWAAFGPAGQLRFHE